MKHFHLRAGSSGDDRICFYFFVFGFPLQFWNRRDFIMGLCVCPFGSGHTFFGHNHHLEHSFSQK